MARLRQLKPRVRQLPVRGQTQGHVVNRHRLRDATQPWRRWYKTQRWQDLRWSILVRDLFRCQRCGKTGQETSQLVADHIIPHRGDEDLFWDSGNLQCLCKPCHDSAKQREERRSG